MVYTHAYPVACQSLTSSGEPTSRNAIPRRSVARLARWPRGGLYLACMSHVPRMYLACMSQPPPKHMACSWLEMALGGFPAPCVIWRSSLEPAVPPFGKQPDRHTGPRWWESIAFSTRSIKSIPTSSSNNVPMEPGWITEWGNTEHGSIG